MEIGKRITEYRISQGYSISKLADLAGVSQSYLRDIEKGTTTNPSIDFLERICCVFGVSLAVFLSSNDSSSQANELVSMFNKLTPAKKEALFSFLKTFTDS